MIAEYLIPVLIILILILLNGLFVAAEFALVTAPRPRLRQLEEQGSTTASRILHIISSPELQNRYITTAQIGITLASLGLGMYGEHTLAEWLIKPLHSYTHLAEPLAHSLAVIIAVSLLTYLHVVLGEMIPKSFALQSSSKVATFLYVPLNISEKLFFPIAYVLNHASVWVISKLKLTPEQDSRLFTSGDLEFAVGESQESGLIEYRDQLFIENILDLEERTVNQVMMPRNEVITINKSLSPIEVSRIVCQTNKSRYPVYDQTPDKIIGVLHLKDFARRWTQEETDSFQYEDLLRPPLFVPEALPLNELLERFRESQTHFGVVLDEFGGTAGIVTLEDLLEEVVGEILDEFDIETPPFKPLDENGYGYQVRGDVILEEINQHLGIMLSDQTATTIGGYVMSVLGSIPRIGDRVKLPNATIIVEEVSKRAVKSVIIEFQNKVAPE